ncbi:Oxidoreductase htatip2 [Chytriomyces hyalinus]|nr:Oxidoreductase htatip2 [Chytriomyces hyalinus]
MAAYESLVLGATGAVGSQVVSQLVQSPLCTRVFALTRRQLSASEKTDKFGSEAANSPKLDVKVVDFDALKQQDFNVGRDGKTPEAVFCCLGTTRGDAGSDEAFIKVDHDYVVSSAKCAKDGGSTYFGLVTSAASGASKNSFFLYPRTKGLVEEAVKANGFERLSIFRPGLLNRAESSRKWEWVANCIMSGVDTKTVAAAMIRDFEARDGKQREFSDAQIRELGK